MNKNLIEKVVAQSRCLERRKPASENVSILPDDVMYPELEERNLFCYAYINRCDEGLVLLASATGEEGRHYVLKMYDASKIKNLDPIIMDAYKLRTLQHEHLVPLLNCFVKDTCIFYTFPCLDLGSLRDIIRAAYRTGIPERAMAGIYTQILDAVIYLHEQRIIHRDIRPHHILLNSDGTAKLTGLRNIIQIPYGSAKVNEYTEEMSVSMCYLAPEVLEQDYHGYDLQSDVYMLGVCLCECVNGSLDLTQQTSFEILYRKLRNNAPRPIDCTTVAEEEAADGHFTYFHMEHRSREFSGPLHSFVNICLKRNPLERPTSAELKVGQWIQMTANKDFFTPADVIRSLSFDDSARFNMFPNIESPEKERKNR